MATPKLSNPVNKQATEPVQTGAPQIQLSRSSVQVADIVQKGVNTGFENFKDFANTAYAIAATNQKIAESDLSDQYQMAAAETISKMQLEGKTFQRIEDVRDAVNKEFLAKIGNKYSPDFVTKWRQSQNGLKTISVSNLQSDKEFLSAQYNLQQKQAVAEAGKLASLSFTTGDMRYLDTELPNWLDTNTVLNAADKEGILNNAQHQYTVADVERDIYSRPAQAYEWLHNDSEKYKSLSAPERARYEAQAYRAAQSRKGTTLDEKLEPFRGFFHALWQSNPEAANRYFRDLINNPASTPVNLDTLFLTEEERNALQAGLQSLSSKEKETYFAWMEKIITDPQRESAMANADMFEKLKIQINTFDIDKQGKVQNKDLNNVESLVAAISTVEGGRRDGSLANYSRESSEMIAELRNALGTLVADEGFKLRNTNTFSHSVSEAAKKAILNDLGLLDKRLNGGDGMFTKEHIGAIAEAVWHEYMALGIDTKSSDTRTVADALTIERAVLRAKIQEWLNIDDTKYDEVLHGNTLLPYYSQSQFSNVRDMVIGRDQSLASNIYQNLLPGATDPASAASEGLKDNSRIQRVAGQAGRSVNRALEAAGGYLEDHTYTTISWDETARRYREVTRFRPQANSDIVLNYSPRRRNNKENE